MSLMKGANILRTFSHDSVTAPITADIPWIQSPFACDRFSCIWSPFAVRFPRKRSPLVDISLYSVTLPPRIQSPEPRCFPVFSHRVTRKESPSNPESLVLPVFVRSLNVFKGFKASKEPLNAMELCPKGRKSKIVFPRKQSPFR